MRCFRILLPILLSSSKLSPASSHSHDSISSFVPRGSRPLQEMETNKMMKKRSSISAIHNARGGILSSTKSSEYSGALVFILLDQLFRQIFKANNISFPSPLGGCCILFVLLILAEMIVPGLGDAVFSTLAPGSNLLSKWLPLFFVPGLAMLPLAPPMGSSLEVMKVLTVAILGFYFTLFTTSFSVLGLRKMQGAPNSPPMPTASKEISGVQSTPKPFSDEFFGTLVKGLVLSGALSLGITKSKIQAPLQAICLGFATISGYVGGALLPTSLTKIVHPLVTSTIVTLAFASITGMMTGSSLSSVLTTSYKTGSLHPFTTGVGDVLLYLLGPSVISFAISMYGRKNVMMDNLLVVLTAALVASIGCLFGTAAFVKLIQVGGAGEAGRVVRLSLISRSVTTPLAIAITNMLGGIISLTAAVVVIDGTFGATFGKRILSRMGVYDPVSRGLGIGAAAGGMGVASLSDEKEAFPFGAISMVLTAVIATVLVSIPVVKDSLLNICM